jgi:hypothetical protein
MRTERNVKILEAAQNERDKCSGQGLRFSAHIVARRYRTLQNKPLAQATGCSTVLNLPGGESVQAKRRGRGGFAAEHVASQPPSEVPKLIQGAASIVINGGPTPCVICFVP